jgi:hypothetical protein
MKKSVTLSKEEAERALNEALVNKAREEAKIVLNKKLKKLRAEAEKYNLHIYTGRSCGYAIFD